MLKIFEGGNVVCRVMGIIFLLVAIHSSLKMLVMPFSSLDEHIMYRGGVIFLYNIGAWLILNPRLRENYWGRRLENVCVVLMFGGFVMMVLPGAMLAN